MTALSVNVNKIAVLRNSRGGDEPSVLRAAACAIDADSPAANKAGRKRLDILTPIHCIS